jgi:hypothetical protein
MDQAKPVRLLQVGADIVIPRLPGQSIHGGPDDGLEVIGYGKQLTDAAEQPEISGLPHELGSAVLAGRASFTGLDWLRHCPLSRSVTGCADSGFTG